MISSLLWSVSERHYVPNECALWKFVSGEKNKFWPYFPGRFSHTVAVQFLLCTTEIQNTFHNFIVRPAAVLFVMSISLTALPLFDNQPICISYTLAHTHTMIIRPVETSNFWDVYVIESKWLFLCLLEDWKWSKCKPLLLGSFAANTSIFCIHIWLLWTFETEVKSNHFKTIWLRSIYVFYKCFTSFKTGKTGILNVSCLVIKCNQWLYWNLWLVLCRQWLAFHLTRQETPGGPLTPSTPHNVESKARDWADWAQKPLRSGSGPLWWMKRLMSW